LGLVIADPSQNRRDILMSHAARWLAKDGEPS
jgi:hypothetical protein